MSLPPMYWKDAHCIVVVFDVTCCTSDVDFDVDAFYHCFSSYTREESEPMVIFCGNKIDLARPDFDRAAIADSLYKHFGDTIKFMRVIFTSALTGEGIDELLPAMFDSSSDVTVQNYDNSNV